MNKKQELQSPIVSNRGSALYKLPCIYSPPSFVFTLDAPIPHSGHLLHPSPISLSQKQRIFSKPVEFGCHTLINLARSVFWIPAPRNDSEPLSLHCSTQPSLKLSNSCSDGASSLCLWAVSVPDSRGMAIHPWHWAYALEVDSTPTTHCKPEKKKK